MHKRPLAVISVFFIIGIVLGRFLPDSVTLFHVFIVTLIFILVCLFLALISWRGGFETRPYGSDNIARSSLTLAPLLHTFLFLSIVFLGSLLYLDSNIFPSNHISYLLGKDKIKAEITGVIKSPAEARGVYYGKVSSRYIFEVETLRAQGSRLKAEGEWQKISGLALIRIQTEKDYQYGDRLRVKGTIKRPFTLTLTPALSHKWEREERRGGSPFNYRKYLENQNIFAIINASEKNVTLLSHNYRVNPVLRYAYLIREKLKNQFIEKMPLESGAFLRAILLGDRSELPKKLNESFRNSGTMHILPIQNTKKLNYPS